MRPLKDDLLYFPFSNPIYLLIDEHCYSSCEGATLMLKYSGKVKLYGRTTKGGSGNPIKIPLLHSKGSMFIPTWISKMPNGQFLEDNGVSPDKVIPLNDAVGILGRALSDMLKEIDNGFDQTLYKRM